MIRALALLSLLSLGCGRSFVPGAAEPGAAGSASALRCKDQEPTRTTPPKGLCTPRYGTLSELRAAMVGSWRGTMESTSWLEPFAVEVTFGEDGAVKGTDSSTGRQLFGPGVAWSYALTDVLDTCDAKGSLSFTGSNGKKEDGFLWWVRPCGDGLFFAYSSFSAGARIVDTYRLERQ